MSKTAVKSKKRSRAERRPVQRKAPAVRASGKKAAPAKRTTSGKQGATVKQAASRKHVISMKRDASQKNVVSMKRDASLKQTARTPQLTLAVPEGYQFEQACRAAGWHEYAPFGYQPRNRALTSVHDLGTTVCKTSTTFNGKRLEIVWESDKTLDQEEKNLLIIQLRRMFALDWDLKPFHRMICKEKELEWISREGRGWFLRSPSLFEDVVKTLLSVNCSREQGKEMVQKLVAEFGKPMASRPQCRAFPSPATLLKVGVPILRDRIKAGYRSQAIAEAAHRFLKGEFQEVEMLRAPLIELRKRLLTFHGMAAPSLRHLLILLGRFDEIPSDGYRITTEGKMLKSLASRPMIVEEAPQKWGEWSGLVSWFEMEGHHAVRV